MPRLSMSPPEPSPTSSPPEPAAAPPANSNADFITPDVLGGPNNLAGVAGSDQDERPRPCIQFATRDDWGQRAAARPKPHPPQLNLRRMSSPPPPSTYESRVSFDTFDNRDATDFSFTLVSKHKHYAYTPRSRTFLCGTDRNEYSEIALEWLLDELVEDGDELVCLRVVDKDSKITSDSSVQEGRYKVEAQKLLEHIQGKNKEDEKSINLILEFAVGKVHETFQKMITIYSPVCLIVGTRGRSLGGIQGLLPGSVSKYCLQESPVPVVVVRSTAKRDKKKSKRQADPSRRNYDKIISQSGVRGSYMLDKSEREKLVEPFNGDASENEAEAVAKAIGVSGNIGVLKEPRGVDDGEPLSKVVSAKSDYTSGPESPSPTGPLSPDDPVPGEVRIPEFAKLDSPSTSEEEEEVEERVKSKKRVEKKAPIEEARKMEAGEGKYLKPEASITDDT